MSDLPQMVAAAILGSYVSGYLAGLLFRLVGWIL